MEYFVKLRDADSVDDLRNRVRAWEDLGIGGVAVSDHLFTSRSTAGSKPQYRHDPVVLLSAIGAMSSRLRLALLVANVGTSAPAQLFRQFAELATLFGGDRILLGMGAGWNAEEFDAIGLDIPPHVARVNRLGEFSAAARQFFSEPQVDYDGEFITFRQLPRSPSDGTPPRIAVGGGSQKVIQIGAEFADHVDFDAPTTVQSIPRRGSGAELRATDLRRRIEATTGSLRAMKDSLNEHALALKRDPATITTSINISAVGLTSTNDWAESWARTYSLDPTHFDTANVGESPFFLVGDKATIQRKIHCLEHDIQLNFIVLPDGPAVRDLLNVAR